METGPFIKREITSMQGHTHGQAYRDTCTDPPHIHTNVPGGDFVGPFLPSVLVFTSPQWGEFPYIS